MTQICNMVLGYNIDRRKDLPKKIYLIHLTRDTFIHILSKLFDDPCPCSAVPSPHRGSFNVFWLLIHMAFAVLNGKEREQREKAINYTWRSSVTFWLAETRIGPLNNFSNLN